MTLADTVLPEVLKQVQTTPELSARTTVGNTAYDPDSFVVTLKPGCDASITRFGPVAWKLDRGQFVMIGAGNQAWRFEENEANIWSRIPAARPPVLMVRP